MKTTIDTIKSGQDYRVRMADMPGIADQSYRFCLVRDGEMVAIYTPTANLGLYKIERFGGALSPAGIRAFIGREVAA